jgi:starch synthase (maltosyl-transferring)
MVEQTDYPGAFPAEGRQRVVIEGITPEIDGGRFAVKRTPGELVTVQADVFGDGHDEVAAVLFYRHESEFQWRKFPMRSLGNDRWEASFRVEELGVYYYTVAGRLDHFTTWKHDLRKKFKAGRDLAVDILIGVGLLEGAIQRAGDGDLHRLHELAERLRLAVDDTAALALAEDELLAELMAVHYDPILVSQYERELTVQVDQGLALFSAWYELFPRSCCTPEGEHGTLRDCERLLPEIAGMGFDIVYLPPIHPIGTTHRKGKNNATSAAEGDPGSPWAVGAQEGGHTAIHPRLGTMADFDHFVKRARGLGLEVALDIAFQASPDHPFVRQHPDWFRWRPDGTVQYAENPPKKYEDIIPFDFESDDWRQMWEKLRDVFFFWIEHGVTVFRVDNPHTKPFAFWEWALAEIRRRHPQTIFLSEAFTRPKVMYRLAKLGFNQSYTYFSWRNTKQELEQYLKEMSGSEVREYFRPNFWPNTPDILPEFLQYGGAPAFVIRYALAATLSSNYGIYGPPYELFLNAAIPGKEEYLDSEKYEIRCWDWQQPRHMRELITRINRIRRDNPALQSTWNVRFCSTDSDEVIAYVKADESGDNLLLVVVSLDPFTPRSAQISLPLAELGITGGHPFLVHELLTETHAIWHQQHNRVELDPQQLPVRIYRLRRRLRREQDFDYFM